VLPLDDFGTLSFDNATAIKNGQTVSMSAAGATGITLIGGSGGWGAEVAQGLSEVG
jgi:hypothetical protein